MDGEELFSKELLILGEQRIRVVRDGYGATVELYEAKIGRLVNFHQISEPSEMSDSELREEALKAWAEESLALLAAEDSSRCAPWESILGFRSNVETGELTAKCKDGSNLLVWATPMGGLSIAEVASLHDQLTELLYLEAWHLYSDQEVIHPTPLIKVLMRSK